MTRRPTPPQTLVKAAEGDRPDGTPREQLQWALAAARRDALLRAREEAHTLAYIAEDLVLVLSQLARPAATPEDQTQCLALIKQHTTQLRADLPELLTVLEEVTR